MKFTFTLSAITAALAGLSAAIPVSVSDDRSHRGSNRGGSSDVEILQFALTLEHLENVFYKQALQKFRQEDFVEAGFHLDFLPNMRFLVEDEQSHVKSLESAIKSAGAEPVAACEYNFPYTDVQSFVTLSAVLEGVGTSAYLGAASLIEDKTILTTAGSILVTESLHTSQQRASLGQIPAANALGTPVSANAIFTIASTFIKNCPNSNAKLPFKAFETLTAVQTCQGPSNSASRVSGKERGRGSNSGSSKLFNAHPPSAAELADLVSLDATGFRSSSKSRGSEDVDVVIVCAPAVSGQSLKFNTKSRMRDDVVVTIISGLTIVSVDIKTRSDTTVEIIVPGGVSGQAFVFITKSRVRGQLRDEDIVAGPAVVEIGPANANIDQKIL